MSGGHFTTGGRYSNPRVLIIPDGGPRGPRCTGRLGTRGPENRGPKNTGPVEVDLDLAVPGDLAGEWCRLVPSLLMVAWERGYVCDLSVQFA